MVRGGRRIYAGEDEHIGNGVAVNYGLHCARTHTTLPVQAGNDAQTNRTGPSGIKKTASALYRRDNTRNAKRRFALRHQPIKSCRIAAESFGHPEGGKMSLLPTSQELTLEEHFQLLLRRWREETALLSSSTRIVEHPAY